MRILTRYILRAHVAPFLFALSTLTGILMIQTVARRLEMLAGRGLPWSVLAEVFVLSLPHILALTLPMSVLVATLYAFSTLASDNELTALKASGVNLNRLLFPLVLAATLFAGGMVWFNDYLLPETNHALARLLIDIQRKTPTLQLKEQTINPISTDGSARAKYYLQAARIRSATNELEDVVIYDLSDGTRVRTIYADSGEMAMNADRTDLFLTLHDGWINQIDDENPSRFVRSFFEQYRIQIRNVGNQLTRTDSSGHRSDREMTMAMLRARAATSRAERDSLLERAAETSMGAVNRFLSGPGGPAADPDSRTRRITLGGGRLALPPGDTVRDEIARRTVIELASLAGRARSLERNADIHLVEYHKKHAISWAVIIFVLLGAPIAVRFPRGGVGMVIAGSIGIFAVYYAGLIGGEKLADGGTVAPWAAMWAPNLLFFGVALWGIVRTGREAASARGGGWDDLRHSLGELAARPFRALRSRQAPA